MKEYSTKGIVETSEIAGTVSDPNCVYILNASLPPGVIDVAIRALVRRLLDKGGWTVRSVNQIISGNGVGNAIDILVQLVEEDSTGALTVTQYPTTATDTIAAIAAAFIGRFSAYSAGNGFASNSNDLVPKAFQCYTRPGSDDPWLFKCELNLVEEYIHVHARSGLKIQNRTLAANNSTDSEDVSSNPLTGRSYLFRGMPKTKTLSLYPQLNSMRGDGVLLVRAAEMTGTGPLGSSNSPNEPPVPNLFWNCVKASRVYLNPGKLRTSSVSYTKRMKFLTWLKWIRVQYRSSTPNLFEYSTGDCELVALEDMINVNAANNISCAYEVNRLTAVYFTTVPNKYCEGSFAQSSYSNNPA